MYKFYLSCEHGGNKIPAEYEKYFEKAGQVLQTHKGWDIGILPIATKLSTDLNLPLTFSEVSRLLVELNRSIGNPGLFSEYTNSLPDATKKGILEEYYFPYRNKVESEIQSLISEGHKIMHISVHSFTPVFEYKVREGDIGLLFDPARTFELQVCSRWMEVFKSNFKDLNVKYNHPYLGTDDGFTTYLRTKFSDENYAGIEIEVNQKYLLSVEDIQKMYFPIHSSIKTLINQYYNF